MKTLCMLHALEVHVGELGSTVRRGAKWLFATETDKELALCSCPRGAHPQEEANIVGHGRVLKSWYGRFSQIPASLLRYEHEQSSRTYDGLLASMRRAYGSEFSEDDEVAVLLYLRTD